MELASTVNIVLVETIGRIRVGLGVLWDECLNAALRASVEIWVDVVPVVWLVLKSSVLFLGKVRENFGG